MMSPIRDNRPNLDILRSFAVLAVLLDHIILTLEYKFAYIDPAYLILAHGLGQIGVLAFFVHTSLVLMYSLDRLDPTRREPVAFRFYVRRAFRIYPLSICCIAVAIVFGVPTITWRVVKPVTWPVVVSNLLLVQNLWTKKSVIGPLWSLPYEVQMYVVLPVLHRFARRSWGVAGLLAMIGVFSAIGFAIDATSGHLNMAAYVPCFLSGVLCYALGSQQRAILPAWLWSCFLLLIFVTYPLAHIGREGPVFWIGWIVCLVLGLTINLFRESESSWINATSQHIAKYSYGLYLWHIPVFYLVFFVLAIRAPIMGAILSLGLTYAISMVTYHAVEEPMIRVGRMLSNKRQKSARNAAPVVVE
jgi:peptidoglycan/LPS O-acetylase OafA/YrhL